MHFFLQIGKWRDLRVLWGKNLPQKLGLHIFFGQISSLDMFCKREYSIKCRGEKGGGNNEKGKGLQFLNMEEMCFLDGLQWRGGRMEKGSRKVKSINRGLTTLKTFIA